MAKRTRNEQTSETPPPLAACSGVDQMKALLVKTCLEDAIISDRIFSLYERLSPENSELNSLDFFLEACGVVERETLNEFSSPGSCQVLTLFIPETDPTIVLVFYCCRSTIWPAYLPVLQA